MNTDFDPACLRLVHTEVKLASISPTPFVDQLYFTNLRNYRSDLSDYVDYTFIALRECNTTIHPYQEAASGTQEKYNDDFTLNTTRVTVTTDSSSTLQTTITSDQIAAAAGDTIHYVITYSSTGAPIGYPSNGNPVVISAAIPDQTSYLAGSATETTGTDAEYSTDGGSTWTDMEPTDPNLVTDLRWTVAEVVDTTPDQVEYAVVVDPNYDGAPMVAPSGSFLAGGVPQVSSATVTEVVGNSAPAANDDDIKMANERNHRAYGE